MPTAVRTRKQQQDQKVAVKKQSLAAPALKQNTRTTQQQASKTATVLSHDQALINLQQSNMIVKTMLDATFGCMTFLRGLLPEGNFEDVQIAAADPGPGSRPERDATMPPASQKSADESNLNESQPKGGRGLRIKKIKRGYSTEADKLLDWIDVGIVEAVEKQYLKACVFAVYLDPEDPTNLVEALTINFHYPEVANSGVRVPQFEIEDSIQNLYIGGSKTLEDGDDSARGPDGMKLRSIGEVKRAIRKLVKSLIITCQSLGELPSRRWVTMRLQYLDDTPAGYEPPFFVPAAADQGMHFGTKDLTQVPDKTAIGHMETGFHSLSLKLTSISEFIPKALSIEEDAESYGGFAASGDKSHNLGKRRRADEAALRSDAAKRRVIWNALDTVEDRGDIDPEYQDAEGEPDSQVPNRLQDSPSAKPIGIRQADGTIAPYSALKPNLSPANTESQNNIHSSQLDPTYVSRGREAEEEDIQDDDWPMDSREERKGVEDAEAEMIAEEQNSSVMPHPVTSGVFQETITKSQDTDAEMLDTPSKVIDDKALVPEESIDSFSGKRDKGSAAKHRDVPKSVANVSERPRRTKSRQHAGEGKAKAQAVYQLCPCAATVEDEVMVQCEGCSTWYHIPCAGYLLEADLPKEYHCIICRMDLAGHFSAEKMSEARSYLPSLTLERRALKKMYKKMKFESIYNMQKEIDCDANDFRNLLERFQELGFLRADVKQIFRKVNASAKRNVTITTYLCQDDTETLKRFNEYFVPGGAVEMKAFGITAAMLKKGYTVESEPAKKVVVEKPVAATAEKENIAPSILNNTRGQAVKAITLPKPSRPVNLQPTATKPNGTTGTKDVGQPRAELARPKIPLPKSKPKQQATNQSAGAAMTAPKGLFRTAASFAIPTTTDEITKQTVEESTIQGGANKASVPEEDVDMGV